MGIATTINREVYVGNGTTTSFSFPAEFFNQSDLNVYKYDTLLGGVTPLVLNVGYTISGTANAQGIYPNGANVVFAVAPLSTDYAVIVRNPPLIQNYALIQNGVINSTALVNALDYQMLINQRLQDQLNRTFIIPDGVGPAFSGALPTTIALNPLSYPQVNLAATGLQLSSTTPTTAPSIVLYTDLQTAGLTKTVTLVALPAQQVLTSIIIKHSTAFVGTSITGLTVSVGTAGDPDAFIDNFDVLQSVSDSAFDNLMTNFIGSFASSTNIILTATAVGANLSALSAGSVSVWFTTKNI